MITIKEWEEAYKDKTPLYHWDGGKIAQITADLWVRMYFPLDEFQTSNGVWFKDIYKDDRECAEAFIESVRDMYKEKDNKSLKELMNEAE